MEERDSWLLQKLLLRMVTSNPLLFHCETNHIRTLHINTSIAGYQYTFSNSKWKHHYDLMWLSSAPGDTISWFFINLLSYYCKITTQSIVSCYLKIFQDIEKYDFHGRILQMNNYCQNVSWLSKPSIITSIDTLNTRRPFLMNVGVYINHILAQNVKIHRDN